LLRTDRHRRLQVTAIARNNAFRLGQVTRASAVALALSVLVPRAVHTAAPMTYRLTFPSPEHHWMQVDAVLTDLPTTPLELRMSRSSPGRYSLHEFAKNVYDVEATGLDGRPLVITRPDPYGWTVAQHDAAVRVRYRVFGDRVDGTYLAVDTSHAHVNMPAAIMWARGQDDRPLTLTFVTPSNLHWQVATQLHPGANALEFAAPNLQYLMDSPAEFGPVSIRQFQIEGHTFRFAAHHTGTPAELDGFVKDVEKIVKQEGAIFGEFPPYEPGTYTFLADYLPYASGDGMEHRNSTVMTSSGSIRGSRANLLDTVAHEFFHNWNVERIRPRSLEPFDLERANMSGELWLAEGFTQYYGPIALSRAGLEELTTTAATLSDLIRTVTMNPGREVRSAEDMSRMAPFTDGGRTNDRTNWNDTYISYYPFGGAIALALDLSLRGRSGDRVSLDDFMRAMWRVHGKPGGAREGYVDHPYTIDDAERRLAEVSDAAFARDFFARYIHGREVPEFSKLVQPAGFVIRRANAGRAWWGDVRLDSRNGVRIAASPLANTPAYKAGLDVDDVVRQLDGMRVTAAEDVATVLRRHKPGDTISVEFVDRTGAATQATIALVEDPQVEMVAVDLAGGTLSNEQRAFRRAWLGQ
jgi:predicted metalloprotease with PDZ domain